MVINDERLTQGVLRATLETRGAGPWLEPLSIVTPSRGLSGPDVQGKFMDRDGRCTEYRELTSNPYRFLDRLPQVHRSPGVLPSTADSPVFVVVDTEVVSDGYELAVVGDQ